MNTYKVTVKGNDVVGLKWLQNIVKVASMGGVIEERFHFRTTFPHEVTMIVKTDTKLRLETDMSEGIIVYPVMVAKTRKEMEEMDWESFKKECRLWGVGGRNRDLMTRQYLKATESKGLEQRVEEKPAKKPERKKQQTRKKAEQVSSEESPEKESVVEESGKVDGEE